MRISSIKKIGFAFIVFNIFSTQVVMADMLFYYSAAVLPAIIANKPVADAGVDQTGIAIGDDVILDGSASFDPNGDTLTYEWAITLKPEGSTAVLSSTTVTSPTFTTDTAGSYTVTLTVNDGHFGDTDSMVITVDAATIPSTLKKTGQTISYADFDDGWYQIGVTPHYTRSGDVVIDNITGLEWQDDVEAETVTGDWEDAKAYCSNLQLDIGNGGWRLPTVVELQGIMVYKAHTPSIDTSVFLNNSSNRYWSSTTNAAYTSYAWEVHFYDGSASGTAGKDNSYHVRCVRSGQ